MVTVTYGGGETPLRWADALAEARARLADPGSVRVIAVDNASPDALATRLQAHAPWAEVLPQTENLGFARACNVGLRHAGEVRLYVLLNPDVMVAPEFLSRLQELSLEDDVAACGPLVYGADGEVEQSARGFPTMRTGVFGRTSLLSRLLPGGARAELLARPERGTTDVDWVSGACLIIAGRHLPRIGGLDEGYFMYWEDADWCRRATDLGFRIQYRPDMVVRHAQGSSSARRPFMTTLAFHRSAFRYYRRHVARGPAGALLAGALLSVRCVLKLAATAVRRASLR